MSHPAFERGAPETLTARYFPSGPEPVYPEQAFAQFDLREKPLGIAASGGGSRSIGMAMGQLRVLQRLGVLEQVGAISYASAASWLGLLYHFAPADKHQAMLLGPLVAPEDLTCADLQSPGRGWMGNAISALETRKAFARLLSKMRHRPETTPEIAYAAISIRASSANTASLRPAVSR